MGVLIPGDERPNIIHTSKRSDLTEALSNVRLPRSFALSPLLIIDTNGG